MIKATSFAAAGHKQDSQVDLNPAIFSQTPNHQLLSLAYRSYLAAGRNAHAVTLTRGDVSGGGKKPWRQKGTGRARAGSSRLPHWTGGGVAFGQTGNENYTLNLPQKAKQQALRQALSLQASENRIFIIENFSSAAGKAKAAAELLAKIGQEGKGLLVLAEVDSLVQRATANLAGLQTVTAKYLSTHAVLNADWIIITKPALGVLEQWLVDKTVATTKKAHSKVKPADKIDTGEKS